MFKCLIYSVSALMLLGACQTTSHTPQSNSTNEAKEIETIRGIVKQHETAYNQHDATKMASFWAQDGDLLSAWGDLAITRSDVESFIKNQISSKYKNAKLEESIEYIKMIAPNVALVDVNRVITGASSDQENQLPPYLNHAFYVFVKNDGKWEIIALRAYFTLQQH